MEIEPGFKPLDQLIFEAAQQSVSSVPDTITIKGNGDVSFYPDLLKLIKTLSKGKVPIFLDYTSGKGFTKGDEAGPFSRCRRAKDQLLDLLYQSKASPQIR